MTRKRTIKRGTLLTIAALFASALLFAGCGGSGGGGSASVQRYGSLQATIELPAEPARGAGRAAASCSSESSSSISYTAVVSVEQYASTGSATSVGSTTIDITCNPDTGKYGGSFNLTNIPVGNNYIVKAIKYYTQSETSSATRQANTTTPLAYVGAIVDTVADGVTSSVTVNATSTVVALATLRYALTRPTPVALSDTATITAAVKAAIVTGVNLYAATTSPIAFSNFIYPYPATDIFVPSNWDSICFSSFGYMTTCSSSTITLTQILDMILDLAGLSTPSVSKFCIEASSNASGGCSSSASNISASATTTTNVPYDAPAFKVVFTRTMDTTVDLNVQATLTASGFSIALTKSDTGGTLTINTTNALSYGTFSWGTTTLNGDTLIFALKSNATLAANGLKELKSSSTYNITAWTAPSNVKTLAGVAVSTTGLSTTGSFSTSAPLVCGNGVLETTNSEACDDGNTATEACTYGQTSCTVCNSTCQSVAGATAYCGDSTTNGSETCDDGNAATEACTYGQTSCTVCNSSCASAAGATSYCGDGTINSSNSETCDDGNTTAGDGCSSTCIAETAPPTVSKFYIDSTQISSTATSTTNVDTEAPVFKAVFTAAMDTTVDLNNSTTLSASGLSIALSRADTGGVLTINSSNALSYGTFAWTTTTVTNDTLTYTLKSTLTLKANGLKYLVAGKTYNITSWTAPSNIKSSTGIAVSTTGISTTGSFTTVDTTVPTAYKFLIGATEISTTASSATGVPYDSPVFKIVFSESMDSTLMDSAGEVSASGLTIALTRQDTGGTLTIDASGTNGPTFAEYGTFEWLTTNFTNDTLVFTFFSNATLTANALPVLVSGKTYLVNSWTAPTTLKDTSANSLSTTGISTTGSFTTQ